MIKFLIQKPFEELAIKLKKNLRMHYLYFFHPELKPINLQLHEHGEFISDQIRKTKRYYEFDMLHFIKVNFDCSRFVDIGANLGNHSNFFERFGSTGWAFEPSKRNYEKLIKNAPKFQLFNVALSDSEGMMELVTYDSWLGNNYLKSAFDGRDNNWGTGVRSESVKVTTLDSFNIISPTFIKIDVEGSELNVLKGSINTLKKYDPIVGIEIHTDTTLLNANFPYSRTDIETFFLELGYKKILSYDETNHFFKKLKTD